MLKKQIYTLIGLALVTTLIVVGAWALKSGKFAGLADTGPAEIDIFTKDSSGNAVGFVDILISSDGQNYFPASPPLKTQSNGHIIYSDPVFQNHTLYLKASKPYHSVSPEYRQLSVSSGNEYNTDFTVTPITQDLTKGKLKGKVTESGTNNPINGAFINVSQTNTGFSNAQGDYGIADITPGTYTVKATRNDYQDTPGTAVITAGQETTLDFILTKKTTPTPSQSLSPSPSTQPDSTKFTFIAEIVDAADTNLLVKDVKVEISPNPIINNVYGWEETSTNQPADETKYDKANLVAEDLLQPTPDCNSKNTTYTVTYTHPDYQTYTPQTFNCSEIAFSSDLNEYIYKSRKVPLKKYSVYQFKKKVLNFGEEVIVGAKARLSRKDSPEVKYEATTDNDGIFVIEFPLDESDVNYNFQVIKSGYLPYQRKFVSAYDLVFSEKEIYLLDINNGGVKGTVTDDLSGKPIRDAVIYLMRNGINIEKKAKTNEFGEYYLGGLIEEGGYRIYVYHPLYEFNQKSIKEIKIVKGKFQAKDFALTCKINKFYDLNVKLLDDQLKPIKIPDEVDPQKIIVSARDEVNPDFPYYTAELKYKNEEAYFQFQGLPCDRRLLLQVDIIQPIKRGEASFFLKRNLVISYSCESSNKFNKSVALHRWNPANNDPEKPDIFGYAEYVCGAKIQYDQKKEHLKVKLLNAEDEKLIKTIELEEDGIFIFTDVDLGNYKLGIDSSCYYTLISDSDIIKVDQYYIYNSDEEGIILRLKDECRQNYSTTTTINGIDITFLGPISKSYEHKINLKELTDWMIHLQHSLNNPMILKPQLLPIYFVDSSDKLALYVWGGGCPRVDLIGPSVRIDTSALVLYQEKFVDSELKSTITHEYGHHVYSSFDFKRFPSIGKTWKNTFDSAVSSIQSECVFGAITEGNLMETFSGGHPRDNEHEFFASYYSDFFNTHEKLLGLIYSLPKNSECRNIIEFAWQFFSESVGKVRNNDDALFNPIGGKIGNNIYTPTQIAKGLWKQSVYDGLKPAQKAKLKASLAYHKALNYLKIDPEKYGNQIDINVVKFNSFIDKILGARGDRGSIEGVVKEQNGGPKIPKENAIVIIGKKMAVTDKDGKFKIENIKIGEQKVRIIDGKTSKALNVDLETVNIQKDKAIKRYFNVN